MQKNGRVYIARSHEQTAWIAFDNQSKAFRERENVETNGLCCVYEWVNKTDIELTVLIRTGRSFESNDLDAAAALVYHRGRESL